MDIEEAEEHNTADPQAFLEELGENQPVWGIIPDDVDQEVWKSGLT